MKTDTKERTGARKYRHKPAAEMSTRLYHKISGRKFASRSLSIEFQR